MINFHVPGLDQNLFDFVMDWNFYMKKHPTYFYEDIRFRTFYGCFPGMIWNGGRPSSGNYMLADQIKRIISLVEKENISLRFTLTNSLITEKHLNDTLCNKILEFAQNGKNEILVNNPILENYLRTNYPNYKYCLSTTACLKDVNAINEATEKYDMVVVDYNILKNFDILNQLKNKDKIELLVDEICDSECPYRKMHYKLISKSQLLEVDGNPSRCQWKPQNELGQFGDIFKRNPNTTVTKGELYKTYKEMGFSNFKLIGGGIPFPWVLDSFLYYFVKPEFINTVKKEFLR